MPTENITIKQAEFTEGLHTVISQYNKNTEIRFKITNLNRDAAFALIRTMQASAAIFDYISLGEIIKDLLESFRYTFLQPGADEAE